jgi:hypothetical protein
MAYKSPDHILLKWYNHSNRRHVMPLVGAAIKSKFKDTIYNGLKREFTASASKGEGYAGIADEFWLKLANAVSDIAMDLVDEMHSNAQVVPGQQVVGVGGAIPGPMTGATVSPGKIL